MPPPNLRRRHTLADAAIALLAEEGAHGLTHRAVEARAGVPAGTATNYARNREALLVAAAERVLELHLADMATATAPADETHPATRRTTDTHDLAEILAASLWTAATDLRDRYLAIFELQLEARRRPALAAVLARLNTTALTATTELHNETGTPVPETAIPVLVTLYSGTLFTLVTLPADLLDREQVHALAQAMARGALTGSETQTPPAETEPGHLTAGERTGRKADAAPPPGNPPQNRPPRTP
ncbi:TetR/AcrR family transcriptional regulator [Actinorugispora endophytica]|uniref:TetR family transcriptional regulator n=1 Tax=Actinorugispora endophytica TaxID=1605990 RepID=A0A4R6V395_9ACTN|nr:TetR/AcrR family transcriptional regulator [Actinorugispora endophytica]TDQ54483.1 TetR family transcriptional regulator [Actinorugispora endophytica]